MIPLDEFCQVVRQELMDLAGNNYPAMKREQTGTLDALVSDTNTSGVAQYRLDEGNGKKKQVLVEFIQPETYDNISDTAASICDAGTEEAPLQSLVTIDCFQRSPIMEFTTDELRGYCKDPSQIITERIASKLSAFWRKVNRDLVSKYFAGYGDFIGGVAGPKNVNMLRQDGAGQIFADPIGEITMERDYLNLGLASGMMNVGAGNLFTYTKLQEIACCNDYGQDLTGLQRFMYYFDRDVESLAGLGNENNFLSWHPGALQFVTWTESRGEFNLDTELYRETTFVDPVNGQTIDWIVYYDKCDRKWKHMFYLHYTLAFMPDEIYKAADERFGTNNTFLYNATLT